MEENSDKTTPPSTPQLCTGLAWSSDETTGSKWPERSNTYFITEVGTGRARTTWIVPLHRLFELVHLGVNEMLLKHPQYQSLSKILVVLCTSFAIYLFPILPPKYCTRSLFQSVVKFFSHEKNGIYKT